MAEPATTDIDHLINSQKQINNDNDLSNMDNETSEEFLGDFTKNLAESNDDVENNIEENFEENDIETPHSEHENFKGKDTNDIFEGIKQNINISDFKEILAGGGYEQLSENQKKLAKYDLLMKLSNLMKTSGIMVTREYTLASSYDDIKLEYDYHVEFRAKKKTVEMFYDGLIGGTKIIEYLNDKFNPIGVDLNGWSLNLESSREELLDTLMELYEKYNTSGKPLSPEARLMFLVIKSAIMTVVMNMSNSFISTMFKNVELTNKEKEDLKQNLSKSQQQPQMQPMQTVPPIQQLNYNVLDKFNNEKQDREIKLVPPQVPKILISQQTR